MNRQENGRLTRLGRWVRLHLLRSVRENSTPMRTALGAALGAFVGIFPTILIGMPLAFFLAGRLGLNRAAALGGAAISMNPVTAPFLYSLSVWVGVEILGRDIEAQASGLLQSFREYGAAFLLGNTVVALSVALLFAVLMFVAVSRKGGLRPLLIKPRYRPVAPVERPAPPPA
jgi:uncharacterized protein (DUF2062 family)